MVETGDCLLVTPRWNPEGGGRERYAAELVTALRRRGLTTTVLTLDDERRAEREVSAWRERLPQAPVLAFEAVRGATHYQLHSGVLAESFEAERRSFASPVRRAGAGIGLRLNLHRQRRLRREREVCADPMTRVWVFSRRDAASVREQFGTSTERVTMGRPGIDVQQFFPPQERTASHPVRALFAGHNFQLKGLPVALRAVARAVDDVTLTIAGTGDAGAGIRLAERLGVAGRIRFLGAVNRDTMVALYRESTVLLHPAVHDPFPRVVLEALACGCPVITTPACGASEILSDGRDGWVVGGADVAGEIAQWLQQLADQDLRLEMSRCAAQTGRQFDFETHVDDVLAWMGIKSPPR